MLSSNNKEAFLLLVRLGIGHTDGVLPKHVEWDAIETLAAEQGLSAILVDGIEHLPDSLRPPKEVLLQWIGEVLQNYEQRYEAYRKTIVEMAGWYDAHGFKMMVLKGYACSLDWPRPEHRPCGDIDIWLFGQQKDADEALNAWFKVQDSGFKIDNSHHHHSVFNWGEFMVENHYDFVNVYAHKSSRELEKIFKELGKDDSHYVEVNEEKVYLPSPNLHVLFLIRHMVSHFAAAEISLRQVLDWAFFVKKHSKEIDWDWLGEMLEKFHMKEFVNCVNGICVEDLGFSTSIFNQVKFSPILKDRVLADILSPEYTSAEPQGLFHRLMYKYHRWQGNAWKQRMCYDESRWSAFLSGILARVIKPSSI